MNDVTNAAVDRPECMAVLGLLPPYTIEDVHKAYKARALAVHPDRGGSQSDFLALQEAYGQAQDYVRFLAGRREWLAAQVEPYMQQQEVAAEIARRGGRVAIESIDWMTRSFGDFAALADRLKGIELRNAPDGDSLLRYLSENGKSLRFLHDLDLAGSTITDAGMAFVVQLRELRRINLARTQITAAGIEKLGELPELEQVHVAGTKVGWWSRWQVRRRLPHLRVVG